MSWLHWSVLAVHGVLALLATVHILLTQRLPQTALGWIGVCFVVPFGGPLLYFLFGVNRVSTRAKALRRRSPAAAGSASSQRPADSSPVPSEYSELARISDAVTGLPLTAGNDIKLLRNGEQAYPAMLAAIDGAEHSIRMTSYIFETNASGIRFIDALARAQARGVDVRVLLDGVGELYSRPRAGPQLKARGVRVARFLPPRLLPPALHVNLRNHRKVLLVDGGVAFTGGMNIGDRHLAADAANPDRVADLHFRLRGPVVAQIEQVFIEDWAFVTGEDLQPAAAPPADRGQAMCRTIVDGPNEDLDKLDMVVVGAISSARREVTIMTPYFLPDPGLIAALQSAALRGVEVTVVLPAHNNLTFVHWASRHMLGYLLKYGVRICYQPPPFVHSKLLVVDGHYAQIGSANLDPRSLRLNFELVVEVYDPLFAGDLARYFADARAGARELTQAEVRGWPLIRRLCDALAWLFTPYL